MIGRDYAAVGSRTSLIRHSDNNATDLAAGQCILHFPRDDLLICCDAKTGAVFLYRQHSAVRLDMSQTAASLGKFLPSSAVLSPQHGLLLSNQFRSLILPFTAPDWAPAPAIEPRSSLLQHCSHLCLTSFGQIIAADAINHRVVVLTPNGEQYLALGKAGDQRGDFRQPCSVAWFAHNDREEDYPARYQDPAWFTPELSHAAIAKELAHDELGAFRVRGSEEAANEWEVVSLDLQREVCIRTVREDRPGRYLANSEDASGRMQKSLFHAVRKLPGLNPPHDDRKHSVVAVADQGNDRVQLLWMYRVKSGVHQPELVSQAVIGGSAGSITRLLTPSSVAFTPKGDLVICDSGHKRVVIVSTNLVPVHEFAFALSGRHKVDSTPVSTSVSSTGNIAVGYKRGGFAVFRGCTINSAGDFERLSLRCATIIMNSLKFEDAKSLATSCTYFWKQLSARRAQWSIAPMQPTRLTRAKYLYMQWSQSNAGTRPWKLLDSDGRPACIDFITRNCSRAHCPASHHPPDIKAFIRKYDPVLQLENGLDLVVGKLYSLEFLHLMQNVICSYFESFSSIQVVQTRVDMARVALRQVQDCECKTLGYTHTIQLLTMLEEHFTGCASIHTQPIFARDDVIVPSSWSFGKLMLDPLEQYDQDIGIPWTRSRNRRRAGEQNLSSTLASKKILPQGALSDSRRETHMLLHLRASERLSNTLSRMFK